MQAVVMHETGNPDVLRLEEAERPEPGGGEVLIRVRAASVNPIDWKYRRGFVDRQLPAVLGNDVSGSFSQAAEENGLSRILIGFHFRKAVEAGIEHGRRIGNRRGQPLPAARARALGLVVVR